MTTRVVTVHHLYQVGRGRLYGLIRHTGNAHYATPAQALSGRLEKRLRPFQV